MASSYSEPCTSSQALIRDQQQNFYDATRKKTQFARKKTSGQYSSDENIVFIENVPECTRNLSTIIIERLLDVRVVAERLRSPSKYKIYKDEVSSESSMMFEDQLQEILPVEIFITS